MGTWPWRTRRRWRRRASTQETADPAGAKIDRDAGGRGDRDSARDGGDGDGVCEGAEADTRATAAGLALAIDDALGHGVTSVQDNSDWEDFLALEEMEHAHTLKLRVAEWMDFNLPVAVLRSRRASHAADDPLLHLTQLKGFLDGSLGSRTAAMEEPYADDPTNSGLPRYDDEKLNAMAVERAAAGSRSGCTRSAIWRTRWLWTRLQQRSRPGSRRIGRRRRETRMRRWSPLTRSRFCPAICGCGWSMRRCCCLEILIDLLSLGVIASMQPSHLLTDMNWAGDRLGPERSRYAYAWHTFLDHGVTLAFGTDYPVESIDPFRGLYSAVTRRNEAGTKSFEVGEAISLNEAIYAYTQASAFAEFREAIKGRLEPGMVADLIVIDRDLTKATPQELLHSRVLRTVVNGETVYQRRVGPPMCGEKRGETNVRGGRDEAAGSAHEARPHEAPAARTPARGGSDGRGANGYESPAGVSERLRHAAPAGVCAAAGVVMVWGMHVCAGEGRDAGCLAPAVQPDAVHAGSAGAGCGGLEAPARGVAGKSAGRCAGGLPAGCWI